MKTSRNLFLAVLSVIAVLGVGFILTATRPMSNAALSARTIKYQFAGQEQTLLLKPVSDNAFEGARFVNGQANAPFTVVEFADYQCPACGVFATSVEGSFETAFISSGKVRYAYRDFPLTQHVNAVPAAQYAACAADQQQFKAMKAILFRAQEQWASSSQAQAALQFSGYANQIGVDLPSLEACVKSNKHWAAIQTDLEMGKRVGLEATPSFVINGYLVSGALPLEAFRAIFEDLKTP